MELITRTISPLKQLTRSCCRAPLRKRPETAEGGYEATASHYEDQSDHGRSAKPGEDRLPSRNITSPPPSPPPRDFEKKVAKLSKEEAIPFVQKIAKAGDSRAKKKKLEKQPETF